MQAIYNEETAAKKMCPMHFNEVGEYYNCIGDACMAWRWAYDEDGIQIYIDEMASGYCGLAGKQ